MFRLVRCENSDMFYIMVQNFINMYEMRKFPHLMFIMEFICINWHLINPKDKRSYLVYTILNSPELQHLKLMKSIDIQPALKSFKVTSDL